VLDEGKLRHAPLPSYRIQLEHHGQTWHVDRKYSDFQRLHNRLLMFRAAQKIMSPFHRYGRVLRKLAPCLPHSHSPGSSCAPTTTTPSASPGDVWRPCEKESARHGCAQDGGRAAPGRRGRRPRGAAGPGRRPRPGAQPAGRARGRRPAAAAAPAAAQAARQGAPLPALRRERPRAHRRRERAPAQGTVGRRPLPVNTLAPFGRTSCKSTCAPCSTCPPSATTRTWCVARSCVSSAQNLRVAGRVPGRESAVVRPQPGAPAG